MQLSGNPFDYIRRLKALSPPDNPTPDPTQVEGPPEPTPQMPTMPPYSSLYGDEGPATKALKDYLGTTAPSRDQFKPHGGAKVASILAAAFGGAAAGPEVGSKLGQAGTERRFGEAYNNYLNKGKGLEFSANLEDRETGRKEKYWHDVADMQEKQVKGRREDRELEGKLGNFKSEAEWRAAQAKNLGVDNTRADAALEESKRKTNLEHSDSRYRTDHAGSTAYVNIKSMDRDPDSPTFGMEVEQYMPKGDAAKMGSIATIPSRNERTQISAAKDIIDNTNRLERMLNDPKLRASISESIGPFSGSIETVKQKWGMSDNPELREFAVLLDQTKLGHGQMFGNNTKGIFDKIDANLQGINQNPAELKATLRAIRQAAKDKIRARTGVTLPAEFGGGNEGKLKGASDNPDDPLNILGGR